MVAMAQRPHRMQREKGCVTPKEFQKILNRDNGACYHCALDDETLTVQHRKSKGMGGSKLMNNSANCITLCSYANGLLESDAAFAEQGREYGWKLRFGDDPLEVPIYDVATERWYLLDNRHNRVRDLSRD
jgi:hypothetical protein